MSVHGHRMPPKNGRATQVTADEQPGEGHVGKGESLISLKEEIGKEAERILESATYASETEFEYAKRGAASIAGLAVRPPPWPR
jgi:hypothetical protein